MSKLMRQLLSVLLVLTMVTGLAMTGNAAEQISLLTLTVTPESVNVGEEITVSVNATAADVVADGKIVVLFSSDTLEFLGAEGGTAWPENSDLSLKVNDGNLGQISIAFAGVYAAGEGAVLNLRFTVIAEDSVNIAIDGENSYITDGEGYDLHAELNVDLSCPSEKFSDLDTREYYHVPVDFVLSHGYMNGMGGDIFSPNGTVTRAQLVTILYRMAGEPEVTSTTSFIDVAQDSWYSEAIAWAYENGITKGMSAELFAPMQAVSREQMVTFFARYAEFCGISTASNQDLSAYTDADSVSEYATASMQWAVETGLIEGVTETTLVPKGNSTRAQAATVVYRYFTLVLGGEGR